jgi:G:T-mismatch repair DNA endonuclease (very short patch repair protein)
MRCLECGRNVRSINYRHLQSCCGLSPTEYRQRHPGAELMDADVRRSVARPMELNGRWRGRSGRLCAGCGKTLYRRTKGDRCADCRDRRGAANPFFRKSHDFAARELMRAAARRRDPSSYVGGHPDPELLSARRREEWARRSAAEKEDHLAAFIAAGQLHNRRSSRTRIETTVRMLLESLGVEYRQNVQVGPMNVDFVCGKIVIECYGDFWHCNPVIWKADDENPSLQMTAAAKWKKDARRLKRLEQQGYHVQVFWESDIKNDPAGVQDALAQIFGIER